MRFRAWAIDRRRFRVRMGPRPQKAEVTHVPSSKGKPAFI